MPENEKKSAMSKKLAGYAKTSSRSLALMLGGPGAQLLLLLFGLLVAGWLLYTYAFLPLQQETFLPTGVTANNPELDVKLLQIINTERIERANYQPTSLNAFAPLFATASPSPLPPLGP